MIISSSARGCSAAFLLTKRKKRQKCLVIDKRPHIAGNIFTKNKDNVNIHVYGAHIFHTSNERVWNYVNQFVSFNNFVNSPIARYRDELYNLPFNMNTFSKMWGVVTPREAREKIDSQIEELHIGEPKNLEEQGLKLVGRDVFEKLIKGYTEKQWGKSCKDLPAFIIKRLPLRFTYDNNYFNDRYQGIGGGRLHPPRGKTFGRYESTAFLRLFRFYQGKPRYRGKNRIYGHDRRVLRVSVRGVGIPFSAL